MTANRVLIAEDESRIASVMADYLQASALETRLVERGDEVLDAIADWQPDLLLLDLNLPAVDGLTLCKQIRAQSRLPIIMVTARVDEIDRLLGLELGADDYICKPFSPREVVARAKAVLRRADHRAQPTPESSGYRGLRVDGEAYHAWLDDVELGLTPVEFRLLMSLLQHPGRVHSRNDLMAAVYLDHRIVTDRTVDTHVKNLRRKLEQARAGAGECIESVYGVGYRLD